MGQEQDKADSIGLPYVEYWESKEFAERDLGEPAMEFRLIYQRPLLSERDSFARRIPCTSGAICPVFPLRTSRELAVDATGRRRL